MSQRPPGGIRESAWVDYLLTLVIGVMALFCCGKGVNAPLALWIQTAIFCSGTLFSFFVATRFRGARFIPYDGWLYGVGVVVSFVWWDWLSQMLPPDTYPPELRSAAQLSWLLALCSFATWRDATRLFQAAPAFALFSLVGVYDTYAGSIFLFFGFLLCLAFMYGRAHARAMLLQASRSGFARIEEGVSLTEAEVEKDSILRAMRRGPWRWMAGPEWAVASAGAVILISLLGAPILHDTVRGISGNLVRLNIPQRMRQAQSQAAQPLSTDSLQAVGAGPRRLNDSEVGVVKMDHARYLRMQVFDAYNGRGWRPGVTPLKEERKMELQEIVRPRTFSWTVTISARGGVARAIPAPSEALRATGCDIDSLGQISPNNIEDYAIDGESQESGITPGDPSFPSALKARAYLPNDGSGPSDPRVVALALKVTAGLTTDWDKANALTKAIDDMTKYNLKAQAVPSNQDAVGYFLFDSHEGYCDLFASAMVILAREAGLDARYAVGYLTKESDKDPYGDYIFRQSDAHSWAEIYFNGIGWVPFDATEGAEDITPSDSGLFNFGSPVAWLGGMALIAVAVVVYYGPRVRFSRALPAGTLRQRRLAKLYDGFARDLGRRAKLRKEISDTPDQWLAKTAPLLGSAAEPAAELNHRFTTALYSDAPVDEAVLVDLAKQARVLRRKSR